MTFHATKSTCLKWRRILVKDLTCKASNFFPKRSKGESLKHYKLSFQHNELALVDMNKVCVLHVKRVIEPQRPLNTNNEPAPLWLSIFMRNLLNCKFLTVVTRWLIYVANLSDIKQASREVQEAADVVP